MYGKNKNKNCPDLELTYYIECSEQIDLDLRENHLRRRGKESSDDPIICQQARIPNNIIGGLQGGEVATATPILVPWTTAPDSGSEQMIATTNDGNMETLETSSSPAGVDPLTTPQEYFETEEMMTTMHGGIVETLGTTDTFEWAAEVTEMT